MPVGSMPYLTRSGDPSRTERSSFLTNSASGTICFDAAAEDLELLGDIPHRRASLHFGEQAGAGNRFPIGE